ncbi:glycosyltransferase family 69 protein [Dothidotthia symphoricarpi CBS 119687]|uniref:Glycosyltransferase family 69 protein n=1 Tax=Dothidotthia symphoricarpi CBS 119687 TaxID=1392245 RepID=A0A6A6A991_9PLEO|nr:glycosyltransferase family 69 protein [Dothidotthia symphoricarpi CBS 119687]KAF2128532.1 glycosyltransferase family 69 protein [Dothidotthia symphoricarpi CBS 119687]
MVLVAIILFITDSLYLVFLGRLPERALLASTPTNHERIFIASIHWNNEAILRSHWNKAVVELVKSLGPKNVFVVVLESGSWDDSKGALRELDAELAQLDVPRSIMLEETTHADEMHRTPSPNETGWAWTSRGRKELRRIPYLANLRNRVMLEMLKAVEGNAQSFDKVVWLNDVVFTTKDVVTLLSTNGGEYATACSLDFSRPPLYYDTFALRDISGAKTITQTWPYFSNSVSRRAIVSNEVVPVQSCWNGLVAMDARPFLGREPLRFRGITDELAEMHLEGSECCLIHADNPLSATKGVYINPDVRVGYNAEAYNVVNALLAWPTSSERIKGMWKSRMATLPALWRFKSENLVIHWRLKRWEAQQSADGRKNSEPGLHCLVNEMQVLAENGWKHL